MGTVEVTWRELSKNQSDKVTREAFRDVFKAKARERSDFLHELAKSDDLEDAVDALWKRADENGDGQIDHYELYVFLNDVAKRTNRRLPDSGDMYTRGHARSLLQ